MKAPGRITSVKMACALIMAYTMPLMAVSPIDKKSAVSLPIKKIFANKLQDLQPSLQLPLEDSIEKVEISPAKLIKRIKQSAKDVNVEPVSIYFGERPTLRVVAEKAKKLAKYGRETALFNWFKKAMAHNSSAGNLNNGAADALLSKIEIKGEELDLFNLGALTETLSSSHRSLSLVSDQLKANPDLEFGLLQQVRPYLSVSHRRELMDELKSSPIVNIDKFLLPKFAGKMVKKYTIFRGPNCFHASLAFQNSSFPMSSIINIKEEEGYHPAMINYDELWRALQKYFYEVDFRISDLKYGDVLIFLETDEAAKRNAIDFRWIRHAAAYLFNDYVFSKGSKSPNTPYTIKTLGEEWQTWSQLTKKIGVKVYRRNSSDVRFRTAEESLNDWIY